MRSLPPGAHGMTEAQRLTAMKKQAAALGRQVAQAQAAQAAAEVERDKAEHALRSMDREFAATRAKLGRAEAMLRSHGLAVPDVGEVAAARADGDRR